MSEMPESLWIKVEEGHHQQYISVYSVPATEHTEYVPASRLSAAEERAKEDYASIEYLERDLERALTRLQKYEEVAQSEQTGVIDGWITKCGEQERALSALAERVKEAEIDAEKCHRLMMEADSDRVEAERRANSLAEMVERAEALLKWIPVSERLPKEEGRYAIIFREGRLVRWFVADYLAHEKRWMNMWTAEVLAWMELPEIPSSFLHDGTKGKP